jgi:hypothetical protein
MNMGMLFFDFNSGTKFNQVLFTRIRACCLFIYDLLVSFSKRQKVNNKKGLEAFKKASMKTDSLMCCKIPIICLKELEHDLRLDHGDKKDGRKTFDWQFTFESNTLNLFQICRNILTANLHGLQEM